MINLAKPDYSNTPAAPGRPALAYQPADSSAAPVVTIITPFFNAGAIFYETVTSVYRQTLQQWEWLIINDGSTNPEALKILDEFRNKDPRIRVVDHAKNSGLSAARNTGFKEARAEFIFQLDADDLIEPTTLEKMAWHLQTHPEWAFTTGFTVGFGSMEYLWRNGFHSGKRFLDENMVTATCLVRKSVHKAVGGYEAENRGGLEDWDFWIKSAAHGYWGSTIPEFFDWYRRRDTGREHWDNVTQKDKTEKFRARLKQKYPALWKDKFPQITITRPQMASESASGQPPFGNVMTKERPRLLFIVPHFELGGADKFNLDLIRQLQRERGYEITVVSTRRSPNPWMHEFEALTSDVFAMNHFLHPSDFPLFLRYLISSRRPDAVCMSNSMMGYQLLPYLRAHFPEVPFVDYLHMEQEEWMSGGYPRCAIQLKSQLARTVVSSQHLKNWMVTRGGNAETVEVCHTNIDADLWRRGRYDVPTLAQKWKVDRTKPVMLYAGRICDQKQPRVFAEVIRQVAKKNPAFTVLVAGDGPDLPWLKEFAERERLKQIRFLGAVPNVAIGELLALTDIFFLPSQWEGISLAIYEAMAMEAVPVAAVVGGQAELVTADCGVLVKRGANEVADYTNALLKLLASPNDRARMAQAARKRIVEQFPIAHLGQKMDAIFQTAKIAAVASKNDRLLPHDLAVVLATETIEQTRASDHADMLHREREELLPFVKHSINWQSACRTGRALLEVKQTKAALEQFDQGLRVAIASGNPSVEFAARVEIGNALAPVDAQRAEVALRGALDLCERAGEPGLRPQILHLLESLKARGDARPTSTSSRTPLVSVIIPCYKQAHFLPEAVASVVGQTFTDWEILIVNDGSPDNTSEVANKLIAEYPGKQIRLVEKANGGLPSARNAGIRAARGKYFLPLDADDKIKPQLLAKLIPILDGNPKVGFAYPHIQHFGALDTEFLLPDFDRATLIAKDNIACVCSLVRKTAWEQSGGYNEIMREGYEDWDFWVSLIEHGWDGFCLHEPLFLYRKNGQSMLSDANQKRERLVAQIVQNHPKLYEESTRKWAKDVLEKYAASLAVKALESGSGLPHSKTLARAQKPLRITYLIGSILGVTGGNQTLLRQAEEMRKRGHEVTIVTYSPKPDWFQFEVSVVQVPAGKAMAGFVPASDVVVATYFTNAHELPAIKAPVKVYYAQGDQFVFTDDTMADTPQNRQFRELSRASYLLPGIRFVPNSHNLANAVQKMCGRKHDAILPVCTDQTIFRPLQRSVPGSRFRLLIVGPDSRGTETEPLLFKGMQDIHDALQILAKKYPHFTAVRMSGTGPEIFARFPCEFYIAPNDEMKTVLFGTSHIHIYASHYDSCPRPPQEAMAAGCAVVCTSTSGAMEYCRDGENALLVPIKSPEAIVAAVEKLIHDHTLREKIAQGGLATAREFPREREWNEWENILLRFVDEAAKKTATKVATAKTSAKAAQIKLPAAALVGQLGPAREALKKKNLRAAWEAGVAALQMRPFNPEASLLLAEVAQAAGDSVSARHCAQHAQNLAPAWKPAKQFLKGNLRGNAKPEWLTLPAQLKHRAGPEAGAPMKPRLTVCLIAKNEERFLGQCLQSVRGMAHQIVVVDTGSTDRTVEIAKEHGAEVYPFAWCDDFSAARNAALEHVTGDWVLSLDADEELLPEHRETILQEMQAAPVMAWRLPIIDEGREREGRSYVPRLFRNAPGLFFVGRVHEQVFSSIEVRRAEWGLENRIGKSALLHHGYTKEVVTSRDKVARNLRLLQLAIEELPDEPNLVMNLGLELIRSGELDAGLEKYREAAALMTALPVEQVVPELRESLLTQFATHLLKAKRFAEIVQLAETPLARAAGMTASQHFTLGLAHIELKQATEAAEQMRQCLAKRGEPALSPINAEILKGGPNHCLALALAALKDDGGAEQAFRLALNEDAGSRAVRLDFAKFHFKRGEAIEALKFLNELVAENPEDAQAWQFGGQIALSRAEYLEFARDWTGEAIKPLPEHAGILLQRAEALLLSGQTEEALPFWTKAHSATSAKHLAALTLCEVLAGDCERQFSENDERVVSQEFLKWYRQLIKTGASSTVGQINSKLDELRGVLPTFAGALEAALKDAREAVAA